MGTQSENIKERALHHAVAKQHDKCMEVLLEAGAAVDWAAAEWDDDWPDASLMRAAEDGYVDGVQKLIQAGADVNRRNRYDLTALILAANDGHYECIELLLNAGGDATAQGTSKFGRALIAAVKSNNIRCVQLLVDAGADVNAHGIERSRDDPRLCDSYSVISLASHHGYTDIVELLLKRGANVNETNGMRTGLYEASANGHYDTMELLIKAGADVNAECYDNSLTETVLLMAVRYGFFEGVDLLIRSGADVNKVPKYGISPLAKASCCYPGSEAPRSHHVKCLELLIEAGVDVNTKLGSHDRTPLCIATVTRFSEGVDLLIQKGADVNIPSYQQRETPVMAAATLGEVGCTRALLEAGADVNSLDSEGHTALMYLDTSWSAHSKEGRNYVGCAKLLLQFGARINLFNTDSFNALMLVIKEDEGSARSADVCLLLYAAGETLDGPIDAEKLPDCLRFDDLQLVLKHICREAIRKHLLKLDPHTHLFSRVPRLGLPSSLNRYLLYNQTLDDDIDHNSNEDAVLSTVMSTLGISS